MKLSIGDVEKIVLVTPDGKQHDIRDLSREDYEAFLKNMATLTNLYHLESALQRDRKGIRRTV